MKKKLYLSENNGGLVWGELIAGTLERRYKRFLADVRLNDGSMVTAHCPNTGSMKACSEPDRPVLLSRHNDPKRKLKFTWELIEMPESLVGVNTAVPNKLVKAAILAGRIPELSNYANVKSEVKIGNHTRLDLMLEGNGSAPCFVEIKNCTLVENGVAYFPDAVTTRGRKHLEELSRLKAEAARSVIFFLIQRMDAQCFKPADHIDGEYGETLRNVLKSGVEALAYDVAIDHNRIDINKRIEIEL